MLTNQLLRIVNRLAESHSDDACWPWPLGRQRGKYGRLKWRGKASYAHRAVYEVVNGDPSGLQVCHHCDNPICVNPAHLFLGTMADNQRDKVLKGRTVNPLTDELKRRTHCPKEHPYDDANTLVRVDVKPNGRTGRRRACRACLREWSARAAERNRQ